MHQLLEGSVLALCAAVFFSRVLDVTLGTLRTVNVVRGKIPVALGFGFCETFIWFVFAREALQSASGIVVAFAYAGGYATGTAMGMLVSRLITRSKLEIQVITSRHDPAVVEAIRVAGYGVTALDINTTRDGEARYMLLVSLDSRKQTDFQELMKNLDEKAFITVLETKAAYNGYYMNGPRK